LQILTIALCLSIGSAVAWLFALYSARGPYLLLWDTLFGMIGAALCAAAIAYFVPIIGVVGLVTAGPACAAMMILVGQVLLRAVLRSFADKSHRKG
jgi:hypothetical protein